MRDARSGRRIPTAVSFLDERIELEFVEDRYAIETMRYVARIAVQKVDTINSAATLPLAASQLT